MLGDLLFEGLAVLGDWILDAVFGDEDEDDSDAGDSAAGDSTAHDSPDR